MGRNNSGSIGRGSGLLYRYRSGAVDACTRQRQKLCGLTAEVMEVNAQVYFGGVTQNSPGILVKGY